MLYSIQFLRGFAALLVVMVHIVHKGMQNNIYHDDWFYMGGLGIDLFFIISGFIMCYTTHNKQINFRRFLKLRIERIIPLYWLFTAIALLLYVVPIHIFSGEKESISIVDSFFLLPFNQRYLVGTGWTLSYEFYFYFIFSLFLFGSMSTYQKYFYMIGLIFLLSTIGLFMKDQGPLIRFLFNKWLIEFVFGIVSFLIYRKWCIKFRYCFLLIFIGLLLLFSYNVNSVLPVKYSRIFFGAMPMFLVFNGFLHLESIIRKSRSVVCAIGEQLGNSSYSLYLSHPFVLGVFSIVCIHLQLTSSVTYMVVNLLMTLFVGYLVYRYIERPLLNYIKKRF